MKKEYINNTIYYIQFKRVNFMPTQSMPETEEFQILRNFSIFFADF